MPVPTNWLPTWLAPKIPEEKESPHEDLTFLGLEKTTARGRNPGRLLRHCVLSPQCLPV